MIEQLSFRVVMVVVVAAFIMSESSLVTVSARYLPTRSQDDRLERLRELLKDMLESDYDRRQQALDAGDSPLGQSSHPVYKRAAEYTNNLQRNLLAPNLSGRFSSSRNGHILSEASLTSDK